MNTPRTRATILAAVALPLHVLLISVICAGVLALLVYIGIALPAVWSGKPARRKAAADTLRQILAAIGRGTRNK